MEELPIIAWHILTDDSVWVRADSFENILEEGRLTASKFRDNPLFEPLDMMAGDNEYIFLSLAPSIIAALFPELGYEPFPEKVYGFGFDAMQLINNGAIVRPKDLLDPYIRLYEKLETVHRNKDDTIDAFIQEVRDLQRSFEISRWQASDYVIEIWSKCYQAAFSDAGTSVREMILHRNKKHRQCSDFHDCEILVHRELSLSDAMFAVKDGKLFDLQTQDGWDSLAEDPYE